VGDADGRLVLLHVLAARAGRAVGVNLQVARIDLDVHLVHLGQHSDSGRRGVDAALALGDWHTLHAVHAAFVLQARKRPVAAHLEHDLLVAAHASFVRAEHFDLPALLLGVARIHAEQVAGEDARLVAARPSANLDDDVFGVARVFRQQHPPQPVFERGHFLGQPVSFLAGQVGHVRVVEQRLGLFQVIERRAVLARRAHQVGDLGTLLGVPGHLLVVADVGRVRDQALQFIVARLDAGQLVEQRPVHHAVSPSHKGPAGGLETSSLLCDDYTTRARSLLRAELGGVNADFRSLRRLWKSPDSPPRDGFPSAQKWFRIALTHRMFLL